MGSLRSVPPYSLVPWTNHPLAPGPFPIGEKCTHGGHPLESPLVVNLPHVMPLHQSAPLMESLNYVARSVWTHSNLISVAVQDGEFAPVDCVVLGTHRDSLRYVEDLTSPSNGP